MGKAWGLIVDWVQPKALNLQDYDREILFLALKTGQSLLSPQGL